MQTSFEELEQSLSLHPYVKTEPNESIREIKAYNTCNKLRYFQSDVEHAQDGCEGKPRN